MVNIIKIRNKINTIWRSVYMVYNTIYDIVFAMYVLPPDSWDIIMLDSEAADNAECEATEVEQMRMAISRYEEDRRLLLDEISQLKDMLKREVYQAELDKQNNTSIINDYKLVRQRLDSQLNAARAELDLLKVSTFFLYYV